jgi:hypothetical protein
LKKPKRAVAKKRRVNAQKPPVAAKPQANCPPPADLDKSEPKLNHLGGSKHDEWNHALCNYVLNSAWYGKSPEPTARLDAYYANLAFLAGVNPKDVIEGMMAAQLFASNAASMECYRRAMLPDQSMEGRAANLVQAAKLTRANAAVVEALAKHRNKGKQKTTIEHVHVYQGGQAAFIGNSTPGEGVVKISEVQPHATRHAASPPMRCENPQRLALPGAGNAERTLPDARGPLAGSA